MRPRSKLKYWYRYMLPVLITGLEMAYLEMPLAAITCILVLLGFFSAQLVEYCLCEEFRSSFSACG